MTQVHSIYVAYFTFVCLTSIFASVAASTQYNEHGKTSTLNVEKFLERRLDEIEKRIERRYASTINDLKQEVEALKNSAIQCKAGELFYIYNNS